jgi:hypothetical protein
LAAAAGDDDVELFVAIEINDGDIGHPGLACDIGGVLEAAIAIAEEDRHGARAIGLGGGDRQVSLAIAI